MPELAISIYNIYADSPFWHSTVVVWGVYEVYVLVVESLEFVRLLVDGGLEVEVCGVVSLRAIVVAVYL